MSSAGIRRSGCPGPPAAAPPTSRRTSSRFPLPLPSLRPPIQARARWRSSPGTESAAIGGAGRLLLHGYADTPLRGDLARARVAGVNVPHDTRAGIVG